ncbi:MAG: pyridoxamine 5'-phosphate oxidase [Gemmatimonadales bacterium]|nr:MAG: pyridoxamine 5'-phosphate oxidase [Gemmatimonadales bacterium]
MTDPSSSDTAARPDRTSERLERARLSGNPLEIFERWMAEAERDSRMEYPNACTLSTVDPEGMPEGRIILLKGVDARGFAFFTNYESAKARALGAHPRASLTFYWDALGRQVRVRGPVERLPAEESDAYFESRPRESRIGAWASDQSRPLESREALERMVDGIRDRFGSGPIPRPSHWGGYLLAPSEIEFWAAGEARLHDRFVFRRRSEGAEWSVVRLNP